MLLATVVTSVPYLYGARLADADHQFTGVVAQQADVFPYLAQIRQFRTALAIHNPLTAETDGYVVFNGLFGPLGWIARLTGLSPTVLYFHAVRVAALIAIAAAVPALAVEAGLSARGRIVALLLAVFAAGWRWIIWVAPVGSPLHGLPFYPKAHDGNTLQEAMTVPHIALADALVCAVLAFFLNGCRTGSRRSFIAAGLSLSFLTSFHPFEFIPLWATLLPLAGALALTGAASRGAAPSEGGNGAPSGVPTRAARAAVPRRRLVEGALWLLVLPLPPLLNFVLPSQASAIYRNVSQQMVTGPTTSLHLLVDWGPLLLITLLTPFCSATGSAGARVARATLLGWVMVVLVLDAIPLVPTQGHFRVGLQLVCAILAAWVLMDAWPAMRPHGWPAYVGPTCLLLLSAPVLPLYFDRMFGNLQDHAPTFYLAADERAALHWLEAAAAPTDVVLADDEVFDMYIAPYTGARPVFGQNQQTAFAGKKLSLVRRFFAPDTRLDERRDLAMRLEARFIVATRAPPPVRVSLGQAWPLRFRQGGIDIYDAAG